MLPTRAIETQTESASELMIHADFDPRLESSIASPESLDLSRTPLRLGRTQAAGIPLLDILAREVVSSLRPGTKLGSMPCEPSTEVEGSYIPG